MRITSSNIFKSIKYAVRVSPLENDNNNQTVNAFTEISNNRRISNNCDITKFPNCPI